MSNTCITGIAMGVVNHTPALRWAQQLTRHLRGQWDQELDAVSGASRRLGLENIGRLGDHDLQLDGISGASRRETRHSEKGGLAYARGNGRVHASLYFSDEQDYTSWMPSLGAEWDFNGRNTTVSADATQALDNSHPPGAFADQGGRKRVATFSTSLFQTLSPLSLFGISLDYIRSSGALGDPFQSVVTDSGGMIQPRVPDRKRGAAATFTFIQGWKLGSQLGSLRFEGRWYGDDWGLTAQTADVQWQQYLREGLCASLRLRGYRQTPTTFARPSYAGDELYRVADIRYFGFSSLTLGAKMNGGFPSSWIKSNLLPDRWNLSYDHGIRDTRGEVGTGLPIRHYQLFPSDEYFQEGTFMAGLGFDW